MGLTDRIRKIFSAVIFSAVVMPGLLASFPASSNDLTRDPASSGSSAGKGTCGG